jgi:hypothetical protein
MHRDQRSALEAMNLLDALPRSRWWAQLFLVSSVCASSPTN